MRMLGLSAAVLVLQLVGVAPAVADHTKACSSSADVSWEVDLTTLTVTDVVVDVPSCEDDEYVGIQLLTDHGDIPENDAFEASVDDGRATFDIAHEELRVEPITGIRVYLEVDGTPTPLVTITVDQRFFNRPGNEQVGLREVTELDVPVGDPYDVPGAPDGYRDVDCDDVRIELPEGTIAQGTDGPFTAEGGGRHVACYQQAPGDGSRDPRPDPPGVVGEEGELDDEHDPSRSNDGDAHGDDTEDAATNGDDTTQVLDEVSDATEASVDPDHGDVSAGVGSRVRDLARTGADLAATFLIGATLVLVGGTVLRRTRRARR